MCGRSLAHFVAQSRAAGRAHIAGYERVQVPADDAAGREEDNGAETTNE
jgi:hypothetical protein